MKKIVDKRPKTCYTMLVPEREYKKTAASQSSSRNNSNLKMIKIHALQALAKFSIMQQMQVVSDWSL